MASTTPAVANSTFTAPAVQVVPSTPAGSSATATDAGGSNFPTAAVIIVVIICSLVGFFIAYKIYVFWYRRRNRSIVPLPAARPFAPSGSQSPGIGQTMSSVDSSHAGMGARTSSTFGLMPGAAAMGRKRESSWTHDGALGDAWAPSHNSSGGTSPSSPHGPAPASALTSRSPSPFGLHSPDGSVVIPPSASRGSFSSASGSGMPRRHMMFGSNSVVNAPHQLRTQPSSSRLTGAPHAAHTRIDIIPPAPLAPPPGSVIAKDKATLDFAPSSGIGVDQVEETLIDVDRFSTSQPPSSAGYDGRSGAFEQAHGSRAYSSLSGRSSTLDSSQQSFAPPHHRGRSSLGSIPNSPHRDPRHFASSSSSSENPSPNSSSTGLSSRAGSARPPPIKIPSASPFPLSTNPTSPLDKLQQRIAQQARLSGADIDTSSASGSGSTSGRSRSVAEVDGYQAPRERLEEVMSGRAVPRT